MTTSTKTATKRAALWNFSIVGLHKIVQTIGSFAFILIIPSMLGSQYFGQFAFITSLFIIATRIGDLGMEDILVRYIPEKQNSNSHEEIKQMIGNLLALRSIVGIIAGTIASYWAFSVTDWLSPMQAILVGITIWLYVIALLPFEVLLGLGRIGKWITNYSWRQVALIISIWFLFSYLALGFDGVVLALLGTQFFFISLGFWWARDYIRLKDIRLDLKALKPHLMSGSIFFLANVFLATLHRSGALAIETLTDNAAQVGFFDLANSVYLMIFLAITQAMMSLLPLASQLHSQGQQAEVARWFGLLQRFGVVLAVGISGGVWGMAPILAEPIFGEGFGPVSGVMSINILALVPIMLGYPAGMLAVVWKKPAIRAWAGLYALLITALAMSSVLFWGARGAALAVVLGIVTYAVVIWYFIRQEIQLAWAKGLLGIGLGFVFLPLLWLPTLSAPTQLVILFSSLFSPVTASLLATLVIATLATFISSVIYLGLIFSTQVISIKEIMLILQTIRNKKTH